MRSKDVFIDEQERELNQPKPITMSSDKPVKYKDLPLDSYFKTDPMHVQYFLKWKLGRKHVAQPMLGGFTFLSPSGRSPNLLVYPFNPDKNHK